MRLAEEGHVSTGYDHGKPEPCNRPSEEVGQGWDRMLKGVGLEKNP